MADRKRYLGDAVYAEASEHGLKLTTENGLYATNEIILEPFVATALLAFLAEHPELCDPP